MEGQEEKDDRWGRRRGHLESGTMTEHNRRLT